MMSQLEVLPVKREFFLSVVARVTFLEKASALTDVLMLNEAFPAFKEKFGP